MTTPLDMAGFRTPQPDPYTFSGWDVDGVGTGSPNTTHTFTNYDGLSQAKILPFGATCSVKGTKGLVVGTRSAIFELQCDGDETAPAQHMLGLSDGTSVGTYNGYPGQDAHSWGYFAFNGTSRINGVSAAYGLGFQLIYSARDVIAVAVDPTGQMICFHNGVSQGTLVTLTLGITVYPAYGSGTGGATWRRMILNTGAKPFKFFYPGYEAWG